VIGDVMTVFDFEKEDPIWDIMKKYGITSDEVRRSILAWAYTIAKERERDEVWNALNEGFKSFRRKMTNVNEQELRRIYTLV